MKNPDMPDALVSTRRLNMQRLALIMVMATLAGTVRADLDADFTASPLKTHALNWYWLNGSLNDAETDRQLTALRNTDGFSGIVPCFAADNWWTNSAFFTRFHHMMDKCDELGMRACINDDFYFPSGSAGYEMGKYPEFCRRRIVKTEKDVTGPGPSTTAIPTGTLMGCVAMSNSDHGVLYNITSGVSGTLNWNAPAGSWKIMIFTTKQDGSDANFLSAAAVQKWISLTYQKFYDAMPDHYGTTINSEFFDDIQYSYAPPEEGVSWTDEFNTAFQAKYGFSPVLYYPALWYDIGANTAAARNMLFGFRNELLAKNFGGTIADWCAAHKIEASGHYASTAATASWITTVGDPIKFFKYTQRVGTEGWVGQDVAYKIQSSACYLYDKPLLVNQNYAYVPNFAVNNLYRMGMESYVRGVTTQYADGAQYAPKADFMPPELSWRNTQIGPELPQYNRWTGRCQMLLEGGRHVADIALLFPIAGYTADNTFLTGYNMEACGYAPIASRLTNTTRRDFTFMHPEVLDSNCTVDPAGRTINLNNRINFEKYKVLIIPAGCTSGAINVSTLRKAKQFYDNGGVVICTSKLPTKSAELDQDTAVVNLVTAIFGLNAANPGTAYKKNTNASGGKAYFIQNIDESVSGVDRLTWVLNDAALVWDVKIDAALSVSGGPFSYLHKVLNNVDYYFFANSSNTAINTQVRLRGKITAQMMDPHTGVISNPAYQNVTESGEDVTVVTLKVDPIKSAFIRNATPVAVGSSGKLHTVRSAGMMDIVLRTGRGTSIRIGEIPRIQTNMKARLDLFAMDGRLLFSLDSRKQPAGTNAIVFECKDVRMAAGAYVCRIQATGFAQTFGFSMVK